MSSPFVREKIKAAWPLVTPTIPYFETINDHPSNMDVEVPIWGTLLFDVGSRVQETMGSRPWITENGSATVALMSYSGVGDTEVASAADLAIRGWDLWRYDGSLWIQSVEGPRPPDLEAVGDVYRLLVVLNYVYQTRGGS